MTMKYTEVYKKMCLLAAMHLESMEVYDEFDEEDEERVRDAQEAIMDELRRKGER